MDDGPILVEEVRDGRVQAIHRAHAVHLDADGSSLREWGDASQPTYWRSTLKPLQAIPFARLVSRFGLDDRAVALACASHSGEPQHMALAQVILSSAGLDESALRCGVHPPMTKHSVALGGDRPLSNNCSGKHAGMLAVCVAEGWPTENYTDPQHPLQQRLLGLLDQAGIPSPSLGTDGCTLPTPWAGIDALGRAYQWLHGHDVGKRCLEAMGKHPFLVAGKERFCTDLMQATEGRCIGKVGASGVYVVLHRPSNEVVAVKASGGSSTVAETLAAQLAVRNDWVDEDALAQYVDRPINHCRGRRIGGFRVHL